MGRRAGSRLDAKPRRPASQRLLLFGAKSYTGAFFFFSSCPGLRSFPLLPFLKERARKLLAEGEEVFGAWIARRGSGAREP